jgi:UDP-glucose 4-epimerase
MITGGAGFIGSHTAEQLLRQGHSVVIVDNLSNSDRSVIDRVEKLAGKSITAFYEANINERDLLIEALRKHACTSVIHFAGLKGVGESVEQPLHYYRENVAGTISLLEAMEDVGVEQLVFSSSATVYGDPQFLPLTEDHPTSATNPYGRSKLIIEKILGDLCLARPEMKIVLLRYFNPCGAHPSGQIGENPSGTPNNLVPFIAQVAAGDRDALRVYGGDWNTPDGTGVRDYIHVMDLARGHLSALDFLQDKPGCHAINLGTGQGYSVLEVLAAFSKAAGRTLPHKIVERRAGDVGSYYAGTEYAAKVLNWLAKLDLDTMCADHWRWQQTLKNL